MKAYGNSFSVIRNNYLYEIPFFQRRYVWKKDNWEELLESLSDPNNCPFLGSIILKENTDYNNNNIWTVIDGQQRLTTLSILMRACFDELYEIKHTDRFHSDDDDEDPWSDEVRAPFNETTYVKDSYKEKRIKIQHSHIDHIDFEKVIKGELKDSYTEIDSKNESKIINCYCYFRQALKEKGIETVFVIWDYLTKRIGERDENGKYLVIIELGSNENEQAIFDTVNTAGVRLTCADTIKNTLFQRYIDILRKNGMRNDQAQNKAIMLYNEQWGSVFLSSIESIEFWNKSRRVGRLYKDNIEILMHCIAVIKGVYDPAKDKMIYLPQIYKKYTSELSRNELERFIKEINSYAKLYQDNFDGNDSSTRYSFISDQYLSRMMLIVDTLDVSTFLPYILHLLYLKEHGFEVDVKEKLFSLERYLLLHAICGETTKNYNNECKQLINGTATIDSLLRGCDNIKPEMFKLGLRYIKSNKTAMLLLFLVELYRRSESKTDLKELPYNYTLEHIMPQKWSEHWSVQSLPVINENNERITDVGQAEMVRAAAVYEIGNMTLLNSKLNSSLRNYRFDRKVNGEGRKRGMKMFADCLLTKEVCECSYWDETKIRERTSALQKDIMTIWGITFD